MKKHDIYDIVVTTWRDQDSGESQDIVLERIISNIVLRLKQTRYFHDVETVRKAVRWSWEASAELVLPTRLTVMTGAVVAALKEDGIPIE